MKKVLLINQSTGYLMIDIVNAYKEKYEDVVLMAGSIKVTERHLSKGVKTDKIMAYDRSSLLKRFITWLVATCQIFWKILFKYSDYEIVYVTNPPMSYFISYFLKRPYSIIVYDIYPDALTNIGIKESNIIYKLWVLFNKKCFSKAKCVFTLSDGMRKQLSKYTSPEKISVIPNWSASDKFTKVEKDSNPFIKEHHLHGKFVIMYSGNIGLSHNVEYIIEIAKILKNHTDIEFLIVGEGEKKKHLQEKVREYGLTSCMFLSWQNSDMLPYSLGSADIAVVTINDDVANVCVPSKTYNILAIGAPILCIAPDNSEISSLVNKYKNGVCFDKTKVYEMAEYVLKLKNDTELQFKQSNNSLRASKDFTYLNAKDYVL